MDLVNRQTLLVRCTQSCYRQAKPRLDGTQKRLVWTMARPNYTHRILCAAAVKHYMPPLKRQPADCACFRLDLDCLHMLCRRCSSTTRGPRGTAPTPARSSGCSGSGCRCWRLASPRRRLSSRWPCHAAGWPPGPAALRRATRHTDSSSLKAAAAVAAAPAAVAALVSRGWLAARAVGSPQDDKAH